MKIVHCFEPEHWIGDGYLRIGAGEPPIEEELRVINHSWINDSRRGAHHALRRVDYQIDTRDVIMCVGVNNGRDSSVPALLASAHNVIAVGAADGNSSGGYTRLKTAGRCKPDTAAPGNLTSFCTPVVSACAAQLLEAAHSLAEHEQRATRSELIKAVLLAGPSKPHE